MTPLRGVAKNPSLRSTLCCFSREQTEQVSVNILGKLMGTRTIGHRGNPGASPLRLFALRFFQDAVTSASGAPVMNVLGSGAQAGGAPAPGVRPPEGIRHPSPCPKQNILCCLSSSQTSFPADQENPHLDSFGSCSLESLQTHARTTQDRYLSKVVA